MSADRNDRPTLRIGHSPDADDAFMWWPLAGGIDTGRFRFKPVAEDIERLNRRAIEQGDLEITAISIHAYPYIKERYALTTCGASMGDGYGPKIVARRGAGDRLREPGARVAIPGERTSAYLAFALMQESQFQPVEYPFDQIVEAVASGRTDAGLLIHEAQLTYSQSGLEEVADLGVWWREQTSLPLPLGGNAIRRDLNDRFGAGTTGEISATLTRSIEHALAWRETGLDKARAFSSGVSAEIAERFIGMYVNDLTIDAGDRGAEAIREFLRRAAEADLCPDPGRVVLIPPAPGG